MKRSVSEGRKYSDELAATRRQRSVKWDEANLEENEKIQTELNPRKISEPKTPYHGPLDSDDDIGEATMAPLSLDDEATARALSEDRIRGNSTSSSRDDDKASSQHGVSDSERSSHEWSGAPSPSCTSQSSGGVIMNGGPCTSYTSQSSVGGTSHGDECNSNSTSDSREEAKRQRFEAHRRQHYDMREALRRGKELVSDDPERDKRASNDGQQNGWQDHFKDDKPKS